MERKPLFFILLASVGGLAGLVGCVPETDEPRPEAVPAIERVVRGEVLATDSSAMVRDGDGILRIGLEEGGKLTILVPSGESRPQAEGLGTFSQLEPGDVVEVAGETTGEDGLRVYRSFHYLKIVKP